MGGISMAANQYSESLKVKLERAYKEPIQKVLERFEK